MKTRKNQACQNQGSVFNIIMTPVKTINITQNQRDKRRTSLGQCGGEETDPTSLCCPRGYRNPLVFTLGAQAAETWCPNHGQGTPSGGSGEVVSPWRLWKWDSPGTGSGDCVGLTPSTWVRILYPENTCLLFTCSLSCLLRSSQHLN